MKLITSAAEALGGKDKILGLKTLKIEGYGHLAYMNGGGNIAPTPDAPQKWIHVNDYERVIDLEHGRMRVQQRRTIGFVFASTAVYTGRGRSNENLDGDVAYDIGAEGKAARASDLTARARRLDLLAHPIVIIRTALDPGTKLSRLRTSGNLQLVDIVTSKEDKLTLAINSTNHLPAWVSWVDWNDNLADVTLTRWFSAYEPLKGIMLPYAYKTKMDFRDIDQFSLFVDKNSVDEPVADLAAPSNVRSSAAPVPKYTVEATPVAKGVWLLNGNGGANSILLEFTDHLTLFEVPTSDAWTEAIIQKARATVPGKPLTEAIMSHHHFDHSGGLRAAIGEGLTIIAQKENEALLKELAARKSTVVADSLAKNPKPIKLRLVDDQLQLKDNGMELSIYHVVSQSHMSAALMAYVPRERLLVQGDFFDVDWDIYWWQDTYTDNVRHRNLQVDRDVPVHGKVLPFPEVLQRIEKQKQEARNVCRAASTAGFFPPGCPVK